MYAFLSRSDLSPLEIARLRVTYGLVKEHVEALEQNIDAVEPETNPMIDPRSVSQVTSAFVHAPYHLMTPDLTPLPFAFSHQTHNHQTVRHQKATKAPSRDPNPVSKRGPTKRSSSKPARFNARYMGRTKGRRAHPDQPRVAW